MATTKNTPTVNRFVMGSNEKALADAWRKGEIAEGLCAERFYKGVIVAHGVDLAWMVKPADGSKRSNEALAAFDFVRHVFTVYKVGADCAAQVFDRNVKGDSILSPDGRKPQTKRALQQSVLGSKEWGAFLRRLNAIADGGAVKRGRGNAASDHDFVVKAAKSIVNRMSRDAEKHDGTIPLGDTAKIARAVSEALAAFGFKL